ncbi:MAG TPA: hypothetical protein VFK02_21995 [Kofleriaceae bacterium]|nr:hypothetical protein [Kofleriaceae bacterium]
MTRPPALAAVVAIAGLATGAPTARAAPPVSLVLAGPPAPRHLRMRPRAAQVTPPPATRPATPMPAPPAPLSPTDPIDRSDELAALRDVREPVSFSLTIGYQVDGARPSGKPTLDAPVQEGKDYRALRSYGFGELFLSTRGVTLDSLSSYFALRFDAAQAAVFHPPEPVSELRIAPPITTWFERNTFEARTGWGELKDFLPKSFGLKKLRLRAGNQYVYGPWVLHLDGVLVAYDGDIVTASAYAGGRHPDYTTDLVNERYAVAGASARVDLRPLTQLPITLSGETLSLTSYVADQPDSTHRQLEIDWQPHRDLTVLGQLRTLDDRLASERLQFRARYRQVTNLVFDLVRRLDNDWRWDPSLIVSDDPTSARRYLDLGPVLPQLVASLRGGTLIAENVDLVARTTAAADLTPDGQARSSFSAAYVEIGGALEVRLRRTVAVSASALSRQTRRDDLMGGPITDEPSIPQPIPVSAATGEKGFTELGTRVQMSLGARRFSAMLEVYGRRTRYAVTYRDPTSPVDTSDVRGGGRVTVDAWIGKRLRLFASYDVSSAVEYTPEVTAYKSLRLTMTGVY